MSFAYNEGAWCLRSLFQTLPGEKDRHCRAHRAGKSTIADLITPLYDAGGSRLIDGMDLKRLDLKGLRRKIGVVPQDPVLLKGSIAFNIAYGCEDLSKDDIESAARVAGIYGFVMSLPDGFQTEVGERGVTLSGGQRQRIAIARAIVRDPRILIMDEATSSLDAAVEQEIQEAMKKAMSGRTSIVIAHRLATVREADRILVIDRGRIVEEGTHEVLKEAGGL